ncbi:MAG: 3-oxoacyl-[acyl-carrier-protein] reductase [Peptococcaceae bacterium]|nr:3-oxoacyl-[acyl-carrier-protein] reductase [Peptococcaceae bacterium]
MLQERTAVITGASRGIGKAIALNMAQNGANIAIVYANNVEAAETVRQQAETLGVMAKTYPCNVADYRESECVCEQIIKDFGPVSILVNNAGIVRDNLVLRMREADFDAVIDVNLKGAFNFIKHLSRSLMKSPAGRIINITSVSGLMGSPGQINYASAKAGLIGLTKSVARELAPKNVTCNAIAPGFIDTDMTSSLPRLAGGYVEFAVPLRRVGSVDEVAHVATFLASKMSSYITGEVIRVDGGLGM